MSDLNPSLVILCGSRFALPAIYHLHQQKKIAAVICYSRNRESEEEISQFCKQAGIRFEVLEKKSWKQELKDLLIELKPLAVLVKTFAFKIPTEFFSLAKKGFINFHYALLPQYRGAFPLYEVLRRQESFGGVTLHYMTEAFDCGPIIMQQYVSTKPGETYGKHEMNLAHEGARLSLLLCEMLEDEEMKIPAIEQDETFAQTFSRPKPQDLLIKWTKMSAKEIVAMILATNPWTKGALAYFANVPVQILYARYDSASVDGSVAGQIIELSAEKGLRIACINNESIWIDVICMQEGYLPGFKLKDYGIKVGLVAFDPSLS